MIALIYCWYVSTNTTGHRPQPCQPCRSVFLNPTSIIHDSVMVLSCVEFFGLTSSEKLSFDSEQYYPW